MARAFVPVIHSVDLDHAGPERADELDTLVTARSVAEALQRLGYDTELVHVGFNMDSLRTLAARRPVAVFNLVEAIGGDDALAFLPCMVLEHLGVPYTGAGGNAQFLAQSKLQAKRMMRMQGLPTPDWWEAQHAIPGQRTVIVKSVHQHASRGMDGNSIMKGRYAREAIAAREQRYGGRFFAEAFVEGREFNIAVMDGPHGPRVMPIPEISFDDLPPGRPHIVDWEAKWDTEAPAYYQTERRFGLEQREPQLAKRLSALALACWRQFGMNGYARVDFRVDRRGRAWILEMNANPCLAPDAGFAASADKAGLAFDDLVGAILHASGRPSIAPALSLVPDASRRSPSRRSVPPAGDLPVTWRERVRPEDGGQVVQLVSDTGMFTAAEVAIALELVQERLVRGPASGYRFIMAESDETLLGYACYGINEATEDSYELYWIAVDPKFQGLGLGREILKRVEAAVAAEGGGTLWAETSSTRRYAPTRAFYRRNGFRKSAQLTDFYRRGDSKVILAKPVQPAPRAQAS